MTDWNEAWNETLGELAKGNLAAFDRVTRLVTGYLAQLGAYRQRDSWDDLVQEVLMALLAHPPSSEESGAIVRNIQTITQRKFVDELRRQRGRRRVAGEGGTIVEQAWRRSVSLEEAGELPDAGTTLPVDLGLQRALGELPEREREAVECRYVLGHSNEEAAQQLGVSLATYKRVLSSALRALRDRLSMEEPPP